MAILALTTVACGVRVVIGELSSATPSDGDSGGDGLDALSPGDSDSGDSSFNFDASTLSETSDDPDATLDFDATFFPAD